MTEKTKGFQGRNKRETVPGARDGSGDAQEVLEMDVFVQAEAVLDFDDRSRVAAESVVHVVAGLKVLRVVGELAATELGDFLDFRTFGFDFFGNGGNGFVNGAINGFGVENDQALVFTAHQGEGRWLDWDVYESGSPRWRYLGNAQPERR